MRKIITLALCCAIITCANGQDWSGKVYVVGKLYPGYYVTNSNDTIEGYFVHGNQNGNQKKCYYYKNETDRKPTSEFSPSDIKSYKVADKLYRSINYSGGLLNKPLRFILVTKDGGITEMIFYSEDGATTAETVFHKAHDPANNQPVTIPYFGLSFAKKLSQYLADYPELSKKVADKEKGYGMLKLLDIIAEYNAWYDAKGKTAP
jgi:hypothetical protein